MTRYAKPELGDEVVPRFSAVDALHLPFIELRVSLAHSVAGGAFETSNE